MKKKILFILMLAVLFSACKMKLSEDIGTVVIDFGGNERAVGSNGLPVIKDASMNLEINSSSKGTQKIDIAAGEEKTWSGTFPAGEKVTIKVSLSTASAVWKGSAEHTVTEGTNTVSIKLKKSAAALNNLLFGAELPHSGGPHDYTLTLKIGSKEIKKERITDHRFCRDNNGRTYLAYNTGNKLKLERYTSEGDKENKTFTLPEGGRQPILASDYATGSVYIVFEVSGNMKLCRLKEDGNFEEITLEGESEIKIIGNIAVYDNLLIAYIGKSKLTGFKISGNKANKLKDYAGTLHDDIKIVLNGSSHPINYNINDLYMTNDSLYVLFSAFDDNNHDSGNYYSLGGIVKYLYTADGTISNPKRIGIKGSHTAQNGIYSTGETELCCPAKVIGFDDENLYIADDGIKFGYEIGKPRIIANKNRIATLNRKNDTLKFSDAPIGITWIEDASVWAGTKTIVWKQSGSNECNYWQLDSGDKPVSGINPFIASSSLKYADVFCHDQDGNLYVLKHNGRDIYPSCHIEQYVLKDDGSYESTPVELSLADLDPDRLPKAIAVDISGSIQGSSPDTHNNVLYIYYKDRGNDKYIIKRYEWKVGTSFNTARLNESWTIYPDNNKPFAAIAADKEGLFVGLRDTEAGTEKLKVRKYNHATTSSYSDVELSVMSEDTYETISSLRVQDGILYALTIENKGEAAADGIYIMSVKSGKLFKVGSTHTFAQADVKKLYGENDSEGDFAPYRFIAIKPKKLVIASDGGWGKKGTKIAVNKNRVWTFSLSDEGLLADSPSFVETDSFVTFTQELGWIEGCGYGWQ